MHDWVDIANLSTIPSSSTSNCSVWRGQPNIPPMHAMVVYNNVDNPLRESRKLAGLASLFAAEQVFDPLIQISSMGGGDFATVNGN